MKHSKLPWKVEMDKRSYVSAVIDADSNTVCNDDGGDGAKMVSDSDMTLIVKAVNNHERLVKALEDIARGQVPQIENPVVFKNFAKIIARNALAAVEKGE